MNKKLINIKEDKKIKFNLFHLFSNILFQLVTQFFFLMLMAKAQIN